MLIKSKILVVIIVVEILTIVALIFQYFNLSVTDKSSKLTLNININKDDELPNYLPNFFKPSNNPIIGSELKPNVEEKFDGYPIKLPRVTTVKINSDGFRDKEYSIEKLNNTFRIIVLGDSITFGWGVENNETFSEILEDKLNSLNNGINYEVLNFGVHGYNTLQEVELLKEKGLKYKPDMVIVGYYMNDVINKTKADEMMLRILNERYNTSDITTLPKATRIRIENMIAHRIETEALYEMPFEKSWIMVESPLKELYNLSVKYNFTVVIANVHIFSIDKQLIELEKFAKTHGWYFTNAGKAFEGWPMENITNHYPEDGHPNALGHKLLGEYLFNYLTKNRIVPT